MCSIKFVVRPSRKGREFGGHLFIRLIRHRISHTITTPYRLYAGEWDCCGQCVVYDGSDTVRRRELSQIGRELLRERVRLEEIIQQQKEEGRCSSASVVRAYHLVRDKKSLCAFSGRLCDELEEQGRIRTGRAYGTVTRGLLCFVKREDLALSSLDGPLVESFEKHLQQLGRSANTISYYMRNLRAIYNKAVQAGLMGGLPSNPFGHVYTGVRPTRKRSLSRGDLLRLYELDVLSGIPARDKRQSASSQRLVDAQRLFFFSFHARGISFVDLAYLRKDNIRQGVLRYYRKKTGRQIEVKVTPAMQSIIHCFSDRVSKSPYLFPILSGGDAKKSRLEYESGLRLQNKRLARLSHLAGLGQRVTTHVARHSWATMAKSENLPLWVISEGLGHSNEKTTYTYLASFERSVLDVAGERISGLVQPARHFAAT